MCESRFYLGLKNDLVLFTIVNVFIIKTTPVYYREYNPAHIGYLNFTFKALSGRMEEFAIFN